MEDQPRTTVKPEEFPFLKRATEQEVLRRLNAGEKVVEIIPGDRMQIVARILGLTFDQPAGMAERFYLLSGDRERVEQQIKVSDAKRVLRLASRMVSNAPPPDVADASDNAPVSDDLTKEQLVKAIRSMGGQADMHQSKADLERTYRAHQAANKEAPR